MLRWITVTISIIFITASGVFASDSIFNYAGLFPASVISSTAKNTPVAKEQGRHCPEDMVYVSDSGGGFCIDAYEASTAEDCPYRHPSSGVESGQNLGKQSCRPVSKEGRVPWRYVAREEAELLCVRAGKRLPTAREWYKAALDTPDDKAACNLHEGGPRPAGEAEACVSAAGSHDMVGNVWEWVEETAREGKLLGYELPQSGFVSSIDENGLPVETSLEASRATFGADYFSVEKTGLRGVLRGGYWQSEADGGVYAVNVSSNPSFQGSAVGFRCVGEVEGDDRI